MTFIELVNKRSSVRKYVTKPVTREIIDRCLEAARLAPSACNAQPWYFIVVDDPALRDRVSAAAFSGMYSKNSFARSAPAFVVVVREKTSQFAAIGGFIRGVRFNLIDIGIACEHFILQAAEDDVGTCWLGWFNERAVKKILGIPKDKKADIMISMGYSEEDRARQKIRKSLNEISAFNSLKSK
jgi:nitroreductase